jgi:hypothetical protein
MHGCFRAPFLGADLGKANSFRANFSRTGRKLRIPTGIDNPQTDIAASGLFGPIRG